MGNEGVDDPAYIVIVGLKLGIIAGTELVE